MTKYICLSLLGLLTILTHETTSIAEDRTAGDNPILSELLSSERSDEGITRKKKCCPPGCTQAQCREIIALLNSISECGSTPITKAGTISTSGVYCLANDVAGDFTITTNRVLFDLNGHTIFGGITVENGTTALEDIVIQNGTLQDSSANAIFINGPSSNNPHQNIILENLTIGNPVADGIQITNAILVQISNVLINQSGGIGINLTNITQIEISNSTVYGSEDVGFALTSVDFARVVGCVANNGDASGFVCTGGSGTIVKCIAQNRSTGMLVGSNTNVWEISGCQALNNTTNGFFIQGPIILKECQAAYTGSMGIGDGFLIASSSTGSVEGCSAIGNAGIGFDDSASTVKYVTNFAASNGTDYTPAVGAPFFAFSSTTAGISQWYNTFAS